MSLTIIHSTIFSRSRSHAKCRSFVRSFYSVFLPSVRLLKFTVSHFSRPLFCFLILLYVLDCALWVFLYVNKAECPQKRKISQRTTNKKKYIILFLLLIFLVRSLSRLRPFSGNNNSTVAAHTHTQAHTPTPKYKKLLIKIESHSFCLPGTFGIFPFYFSWILVCLICLDYLLSYRGKEARTHSHPFIYGMNDVLFLMQLFIQ